MQTCSFFFFGAEPKIRADRKQRADGKNRPLFFRRGLGFAPEKATWEHAAMPQMLDSQPLVGKTEQPPTQAAVLSTPFEKLVGYLQKVRKLLRRQEKLRLLALWLQATSVVGLAFLALAARVGPHRFLLPSALLFALCSVSSLGLLLWATHRRRQTDEAMARFVGKQLPDLQSELLSVIELERDAQNGPADAPERALLGELTERTLAALGTVQPSSLLGGWPHGWSLALALGLSVTLGAAFVVPCAEGLHAIVSPVPPEPLQVATEPLLGDIRLLLVYPKYSGLGQRTIPGSTGDILALPGTHVRIEAWALLPVETAQLFVTTDGGAQTQPVQVSKPASGTEKPPLLSASLLVQKAGFYFFAIRGRGAFLREGQDHRITLETDHPPRIDLFAPAAELEVTSTRRIELAYSAEDDLGLGDIDLVYRLNQGAERRKRLRTLRPEEILKHEKKAHGLSPPSIPRNLAAKIEWDLSELDLSAGVRVTYFAEARDLNDVTGPGIGRSREYVLFVQSPRQRQEALLQSQTQLREQAVQLLGDRVEFFRELPAEPKDSLDAETLERTQAVHRKSETFLLLMGRVLQDLGRLKDRAKDLHLSLQDMADRLGKLNQDEAALLQEIRKTGPKNPTRRPRDLLAMHERFVAELERDTLRLDDLIGRQRLEEMLSVGDEMTQLRDRLRQLMSDYQKKPDETLRKEIERELRALERRMAELSEKAQALSRDVPDDFVNREALGQNDLQNRIDKMRELLQKGDVARAREELDRMSQTLDHLLHNMEQDLRGYRRERFSAEEKALAELENQLADLSHDQQLLRERTDDVRHRASARARQLLRDRTDALSKKLLPEVQKLRRLLEDVDVDPIGPWGQDEMSKVHKRLDDLLRMLEQGDLEEAKAMAQEAEQTLFRIEKELRTEEDTSRWGQRQRLSKSRAKAEQGKNIAKDIVAELDRALPNPEELLSPSERKQLGDLRNGQEQLRRRTQDFLKDMQKRAKETKDARQLERLAGDAQGAMQKAGLLMEQASGELRKLRPRVAATAQEQALLQLGQLRKEMQNARRPKDSGAGLHSEREPIKIPGADEYKPPKEFRKDILDAAKRETPSEYREQVRRYYEELIK